MKRSDRTVYAFKAQAIADDFSGEEVLNQKGAVEDKKIPVRLFNWMIRVNSR